MQATPSSQSGFENRPPGRGGMRVTAFWSVVGIVVVAAILSVALDSSLRLSPAATTPMNLAAPQPAAFIPMTGEVDFNDRFGAEKRNAKVEELPAQF